MSGVAASQRFLAALRDGAFLNRRRALGWSGVLLAEEVGMLVFLILWTHGLIVPLRHALTTDFSSFYAAGRLALAGTPQLAYDQAAHYLAEQAATARGIDYSFFFYPPIFLLVCAALARLPYMVAYVVFEAVGLALYVLAAWRILRPRSWTGCLPILAFPSVVWTVGIGQNAAYTAALFGFGLLLLERRPALAGVVLGLLCYKPHFGILLPVALAAGGHWRAFAAAAATVAALVLASFMAFGWQTWADYLHAFAGSGSVYATGKVAIAGYVTPFGAALLAGAPPRLAMAVQAMVSLLCAVAVWRVWRGPAPLAARAGVLIAATLLSVPLALFYDLLPLALCIFWFARAGQRDGFLPWEKFVLASLYLVPLISRYVGEGLLHLPLGPVAGVAVLSIGLLRARPAASAAADPAVTAVSRRAAVG
jgi:multidrug transporter EmrE-like cation transporter